jgi:Flp pilus assembly protein TadD
MNPQTGIKRVVLSMLVVAALAVFSLEMARGLASALMSGAQPAQALPQVSAPKIAEAREALKNGETDRAIALLNEAQTADPSNWEIYHLRGVAHAGKEDFTAAATDLEKAIELNPNDAMNHYYAGMVYGRLNQTDKMVNHYETFLRLAPDSPDAPKVQSLLRSVR